MQLICEQVSEKTQIENMIYENIRSNKPANQGIASILNKRESDLEIEKIFKIHLTNIKKTVKDFLYGQISNGGMYLKIQQIINNMNIQFIQLKALTGNKVPYFSIYEIFTDCRLLSL